MISDTGNVGLSGATGSANQTASSIADVQNLIDLQFEQGLQLSQLRTQSNMVGNLISALQSVANNVRAQ